LGDRLREIAETPLLLRMLCDVFGQTGQIPENKGELFRLFDREYDKFKGFPPVSKDSRLFKSEILQHLAFVMMTGDSSKPTEFWLTIDRGMAEREIERFLIDRVIDPAAKAKEWLENVLKYHLLQVAADANQIEFHHQLFQEYYAAKKLIEMFNDGHPDVINKQRFQHFYLNLLMWKEALGILLGLFNEENQVLHIVRLGMKVDCFLGAYLACNTKPKFHLKAIGLINAFIEKKSCTKWVRIIFFQEMGLNAIPYLLPLFKDLEFYLAWDVIEAMHQGKEESPESTTVKELERISGKNFVPRLWQELEENLCIENIRTILAIQKRCGFYNHNIFDSPPIPPQVGQQPFVKTTNIYAPNTQNLKIFENINQYQESN
jgi:hypothetical protein